MRLRDIPFGLSISLLNEKGLGYSGRALQSSAEFFYSSIPATISETFLTSATFFCS